MMGQTRGERSMLTNDELNVLFDAVETFGGRAQADVLIEEMAELTQAIVKERRALPSNIAEEIADVYIMILQAMRIYDCFAETEDWLHKKIARLKDRIPQGDKPKS